MIRAYQVYHVLAGIAVLLIDIVTKMCAAAYCDPGWTCFPGVRCQVVYNPGITWGISSSMPILRMLVGAMQLALIIALSVYSIQQTWRQKPAWGPVLISAGGIGNILSRMYYPGVVDFIVIGFRSYTWPAFNVADIAICVGAFVWLWHYHAE